LWRDGILVALQALYASCRILLRFRDRAAKVCLSTITVGIGAPMTVQVNITPNGRMSLPADIRKRLGLIGGGAVYLDETPDGLVLRTAAQAVARAQALAKQYTEGNLEASVEAFLAKRREDSGE
jgi:AbrB family looped-hinge helix DNA binding protein